MSEAALKHVKAWTHPQAKRSVRAFFEAIADRIPEGQTTTPSVTLDKLASDSRQVERTARTNRDFLVGIGQVKVHDGGRGIKDARYEMLQLTSGERPIVPAPLPLLGRPKPPTPKKAKGQWRTSDLFADLEDQRSDQRSDLFADVAQRSDLFADVWQKVGSFCRPLWKNIGSFCRPLLPLGIDTRARDVHTFKEVHTHTALRDEPLKPDAGTPPPPAIVHPWHAWCPPVGSTGVCVPTELHEEFKRKGHETAWLFAFYSRRCTAIPAGEKIRVNDFTFWRAALKAELAATPVRAPDVHQSAIEENIWTQVLPRIQVKVDSGTFFTWFRPTVLIADHGTMIEVANRGPNSALAADWLRRHHHDLVRAALEEVRPGTQVAFVAVEARQKFG